MVLYFSMPSRITIALAFLLGSAGTVMQAEQVVAAASKD